MLGGQNCWIEYFYQRESYDTTFVVRRFRACGRRAGLLDWAVRRVRVGLKRELDCISRALLSLSLGIVGPGGMDDRTKEASRLNRTHNACSTAFGVTHVFWPHGATSIELRQSAFVFWVMR